MASRRKRKKKNLESTMIENHVEAIGMNRKFERDKRRMILRRNFSPTYSDRMTEEFLLMMKYQEILFRKFSLTYSDRMTEEILLLIEYHEILFRKFSL